MILKPFILPLALCFFERIVNEDKKNGAVVRRISELEPALTFFLQNLSNWNNALVKNISVIEDFSPQIILEKWRDVLNG